MTLSDEQEFNVCGQYVYSINIQKAMKKLNKFKIKETGYIVITTKELKEIFGEDLI